ncbi:MAG: Hsp20/alpha crystallin family protein [Patescibacteria group bacterium]|jgi:HSP20 family protein
MFNQNSPFSSKISNLLADDFESQADFFQEQQARGPVADPYPIGPANNPKPQNMPQPVAPVQEGQQWLSEESQTYDGQLAVDVFQDRKNIYVKAAIAGVRPSEIEIYLNNDMLTIKGQRKSCQESIEEDDYYIKECYWGGFSRSIILPVDVKNDQVKAVIENGLLTIILPKSKRPKNTRIEVKEIKS